MNFNLRILDDETPFLNLILVIIISVAFFFIFTFFSFLLISQITGTGFLELGTVISNPENHPQGKLIMYLAQALTAFGLFIAGPLFYLKVRERKPLRSLSTGGFPDAATILMLFLIVIIFMFFNAPIIQWNQDLTFPESLKGLETWAKEKEEVAKKLTEFFTRFNSPIDLIPAVLVVAVLPAIGEELLFRGLIQNKLFAMAKNPHVAIWTAGILFSFFHFQLFGFVPRMLLGVLFGYLYYWSANLWVPIIAHFINNGFTILALYLSQKKIIDMEIPVAGSLAAMAFTFILCYMFYRKYNSKTV
jgi:uncharacterized protein